MKRKRKNSKTCLEPPSKRAKAHVTPLDTGSTVCHPVLQRFYPHVLTLRHYLLSKLSPTSKRRRRLLEHIGHVPNQVIEELKSGSIDALRELLDGIVVGFHSTLTPEKDNQGRIKELQQFSQLSASTAGFPSSKRGTSQSEVRLSVLFCGVVQSPVRNEIIPICDSACTLHRNTRYIHLISTRIHEFVYVSRIYSDVLVFPSFLQPPDKFLKDC